MTPETDAETKHAPADPAGRPKAPRRRRGPVFYVGVLLVLAGLGMLGYVGWEYYGTNVVAHHRQQQIVDSVRQQWHTGAGAQAQASGETQGKTKPATPVPGGAEALIRIPRFGSDYVMPVLAGVGDDALASGFGHFEKTADPGEKGNYALAAHRVTHGEPLRHMPELRPGDKVVVETRDKVYTYRLDTNPNNLVVGFQDVWVLDPVPDNPARGGVEPRQKPGQRLITLTTCAELFHTDERMVAFGHLVDTADAEAR